MRTDQMIGLNERGQALVAGVERVPHETFAGAWNTMRLSAYVTVTPGGRGLPAEKIVHYTEFVQADPWSSGPCYFLALKNTAGEVVPDSLWTQEEIEAAL